MFESFRRKTQTLLFIRLSSDKVVKKLPNRYNRVVEIKRLHPSASLELARDKSLRVNFRQMSTVEAIELQKRLASEVSRTNAPGANTPRFIGGVDISIRRGEELATASAVVLSYPELQVVETKVARGRLDFPYVPGLLSFRELPLTLAACEQLSVTPDLIMVDGQGIAHPRRFGIASHLGLFLDIPTIGCAKSLLIGSHETPGVEPGSYAEITDDGETIGAALRTKPGVKPIYVSIGHKIDLPTAMHWVLKCCRGYRLPEPTRLAHQAANGFRVMEMSEIIGNPSPLIPLPQGEREMEARVRPALL